MATEEIEYVTFRIVVSYVKQKYSEKKIYYNSEELLRMVNRRNELEDASCLLRMGFKLISEHNSKIQSKITQLDNMNFRKNYLESSVFAGISIPLRQISKLIDENPDKNYYEISRMLG